MWLSSTAGLAAPPRKLRPLLAAGVELQQRAGVCCVWHVPGFPSYLLLVCRAGKNIGHGMFCFSWQVCFCIQLGPRRGSGFEGVRGPEDRLGVRGVLVQGLGWIGLVCGSAVIFPTVQKTKLCKKEMHQVLEETCRGGAGGFELSFQFLLSFLPVFPLPVIDGVHLMVSGCA